MTYRAVLFDLDGTLLDTLADIAESANAVLRQFGFPTHRVDDYRWLVGDGVKVLFEKALPAGASEPDWIAKCGEAFGEFYGRNWNHATRPYEGIAELLDALEARRIKMAVLSNKPHQITRLCVEEFFAGWDFEVVLGQREGVPRKPDPTGALEVARQMDIRPQQFVYLGDTPTDVETARGAGMLPVGVAWGFRPATEIASAGAAAIIKRPIDLMEFINGRWRKS